MKKSNPPQSSKILQLLKENGKLKKPKIPFNRSFMYKC